MLRSLFRCFAIQYSGGKTWNLLEEQSASVADTECDADEAGTPKSDRARAVVDGMFDIWSCIEEQTNGRSAISDRRIHSDG